MEQGESPLVAVVEQKRRDRLRLIGLIYQLTNAKINAVINGADLADHLEMDREYVFAQLEYLAREGLLRSFGRGALAITHEGVREVEESIVHPNQSTEHLAAASTVYQFNTTINNQSGTVALQQGAQNSPMTVKVQSTAALEEVIRLLKAGVADAPFPPAEKAAAEEDVKALESQAKRPKLNWAVVHGLVSNVVDFLKGSTDPKTIEVVDKVTGLIQQAQASGAP